MSSEPHGAPKQRGDQHGAVSPLWRIVHSLWLVLPIVGAGGLGGLGFLYVGLRARRPSWWIAGVLYVTVCVLGIVLIDEPGEAPTTIGNLAIGVVLITWVASVVHAFLINPSWLRWLADRRTSQPPPWPAGPHPSVPSRTPAATELTTTPSGPFVARSSETEDLPHALAPLMDGDPPIAHKGPQGGRSHVVLFVLGGIFFGLAAIVTMLVLVVVANAESDGDRQVAGFFLTAAVVPCGISVVFLLVGLLVMAMDRRVPR